MKEKYFEVKYPNYGIEITLKNDDILLFTLYYSSKTGPCLLVEDTLNIDEYEQDLLRLMLQHGDCPPHICNKYNKQVIHSPYSEPWIHPCEECEKGD